MSKYNRKCLLCGKEYEYCPTCTKDYNKPIWYRNFHEENCRTIFYILTDYKAGNLSKEDAVEALDHCNLDNQEGWSDRNRELLEEILA